MLNKSKKIKAAFLINIEYLKSAGHWEW